MYDYEIFNYLQSKNGSLSSDEYLYVCDTCPQIKHIKYNAFEDKFEISTDCNNFKFYVYCKENE